MNGNLFDVQDDGVQPWPFIITADGEQSARVTDADTADRAVLMAAQIAGEGWPSTYAVVRALQEGEPDDAEGRTDAPGWVSWPDWLDLQTTDGTNTA